MLRYPLALLLLLMFLLAGPIKADAFLYPQMFIHENPTLLVEQGDQAVTRKQWEQAVSSYSQAINTGDLDPANMALAYEKRGQVWLKLAKPHQALADFRRSIEIAPSRASAFYARAKAWLAIGAKKQAQEDYATAHKLCPDCPPGTTSP